MLQARPQWYDRALDSVEITAAKVNDIENWPVDDAAAVIGVETAWLAGLLLGVKFLLGGLVTEYRRVSPRRG